MHYLSQRNVTNRPRGYTLVEMLVAIAIILVIVPVLFGVIISLYRGHSSTLARTVALTEATKGVKEIVRDVRSAVYAENGALPIVATGTSTLTLYADTDLDGRVERVRYFLNGTNVSKGIVEPSATSSYDGAETVQILSPGIVNAETAAPLFRYYTSTSSALTGSFSPMVVRRVEVEFFARSTLGRQMTDVPLRSSATIRNLKDTY